MLIIMLNTQVGRRVSFSRTCWESFALFYDDDVYDIEVPWPSLHYAAPGSSTQLTERERERETSPHFEPLPCGSGAEEVQP